MEPCHRDQRERRLLRESRRDPRHEAARDGHRQRSIHRSPARRGTRGWAYSASKAAVIAITKAIGKDVANTGILANCIAPGRSSTPPCSATSPRSTSTTWSRASCSAGSGGPTRSPPHLLPRERGACALDRRRVRHLGRPRGLLMSRRSGRHLRGGLLAESPLDATAAGAQARALLNGLADPLGPEPGDLEHAATRKPPPPWTWTRSTANPLGVLVLATAARGRVDDGVTDERAAIPGRGDSPRYARRSSPRPRSTTRRVGLEPRRTAAAARRPARAPGARPLHTSGITPSQGLDLGASAATPRRVTAAHDGPAAHRR